MPSLSLLEQSKWAMKWYWKVDGVGEIQRHWRSEFGTLPPSRVTITRSHNESETVEQYGMSTQ